MKTVTKTELKRFLKKHEGWQANKKETELKCEVEFPNYIDGLVLIARIAVHAEILNHHPDITYSYNRLRVKLTTHEAKGITKLDTALAERIDKIFS